jgi:hypothetical protein
VAKKRPILRGAKGDDGLHRTFELADAGVLLRHEARRTFAERKATMKCRAAHGVCLLQNPFAERRATMVGPSNRPRRVIGLTAEAGGRSSRPNHALDGRGRGVHSPRSLKGLHPAGSRTVRNGGPYEPKSPRRFVASRSPGHSASTARHWRCASSTSPRSCARAARLRRVRWP